MVYKVELDDRTIDKFVGKRVAEFNKRIRQLEEKLERRDNKIARLERELEVYKGNIMDTEKETKDRIYKFATVFVKELENANWVEKPIECGCDCYSCEDCTG